MAPAMREPGRQYRAQQARIDNISRELEIWMNATTAAGIAGSRRDSWRAVIAASIGNALEWFDLVVYGFFAVTISKLFFPAGNDTVSLLLTLGTFGVSFFMRPLGAIVIGAYADRAGRKAALTLSIRSEEHTSELQSHVNLVCRLLLEKKN